MSRHSRRASLYGRTVRDDADNTTQREHMAAKLDLKQHEDPLHSSDWPQLFPHPMLDLSLNLNIISLDKAKCPAWALAGPWRV
jgi:hypothetical protein